MSAIEGILATLPGDEFSGNPPQRDVQARQKATLGAGANAVTDYVPGSL